MKYFIYFLFALILCGISVGLSPVLSVRGQAPQLLFLLVFVWALDKSNASFLFIAFCSGLFMDFYTGSWVGSFTLPFLVLSLLVRLLMENLLVLELKPLFLAALLLPAQILFDALYLLSMWLQYKLHLPVILPSVHAMVSGFAAAFIYNLIFIYPVFLLTGYVQSLVSRFVEREYKIR